ncbi:MAG: uroporphyrinogen decarboxylase family protein [Alphaproteobacteria bacterium]|jgi:5-methyltetrahydropteroyltriglutamate--homocysteine methyltransferase|nr:uroporphyrinogen decarboxylase family protein [Alphaproteobacteria bacterium]MDP6237362.1 uroporphyrinogen decarboxylase family protein [Alphaproteobacteria bacterium]MDP7234925.1 uroporphyrinogen decarboxylase family protein [Alphaproteobacteria bacterium]HJN21732.1 uroporphyrinogen decarboxylase family protein [Alphaproteobacteria bacterium]|tara:strand:+ start:4146 stop:5177 length:1032 start_codon:yes stop_codon:yes gene_type:complete
MANKLLPTSGVGSYAQPDWLIDREALAAGSPPRVRRKGLWRVEPKFLEEAQDDATIIAIRDQERAGIDIITDGETRRESYSNRFSTALDGIDTERVGTATSRKGTPNDVPLVSGPIKRCKPIGVRDVEFLRANTDRQIKATLPGPFTMSEQAEDAYYKDPEALAMAYAEAVNAEMRDLFAAGADVVQIDEPFVQARPDNARAYAIPAIDKALEGIKGTTALHLCMGYAAMIKQRYDAYHFLTELAECTVDQISLETAQPDLDLSVLAELSGKNIILGVINMNDMAIEAPETVAERIERAYPHVPPERIIPAPDCGFKYIAREISFAKLQALVAGTDLARSRLS